jgi:hypothetical protein
VVGAISLFWRAWQWQDWALVAVILLNLGNFYYSRRRTKIAEKEHLWKVEKYERKNGK